MNKMPCCNNRFRSTYILFYNLRPLKERSSKNTTFVLCANIFQRNALNAPLYLRNCLEKEEIRKLKGRKQSILAQCEEQQEISGTVSVRMSDPNGSLRRRHNEPG